jgi:hypothetical protein
LVLLSVLLLASLLVLAWRAGGGAALVARVARCEGGRAVAVGLFGIEGVTV